MRTRIIIISFSLLLLKSAGYPATDKFIVTFAQADNIPIIINEFMAQNSTTIVDPQGDYDDWIELKNVTSGAIDLSGMYLSDNLSNPLKWKIPDGTQLQPGGYLLVWADENGNAPIGLHANFKLSANGEVILLFDSDANGNALLDSVSFGVQNTDVSFGRYPEDVTGVWQFFSHPTPGLQNDASSYVANNTNIPQELQVFPAYPNPFNPITTIRYQLTANSLVNLRVYDLLGREVAKLIDDQMEAGYHTATFDGTEFSSGVYFMRFEARYDNGKLFVQTSKLLLQK